MTIIDAAKHASDGIDPATNAVEEAGTVRNTYLCIWVTSENIDSRMGDPW